MCEFLSKVDWNVFVLEAKFLERPQATIGGRFGSSVQLNDGFSEQSVQFSATVKLDFYRRVRSVLRSA